jgi:hypothetical protein
MQADVLDFDRNRSAVSTDMGFGWVKKRGGFFSYTFGAVCLS